MTDIIVTIPKSEEQHVMWDKFEAYVPVVDKANDDNISFWNLHRKPKELECGDYIWFVLKGKLYAKALVEDIETEVFETECDYTGRMWKGIHVWFKEVDFLTELEQKPMKGFQGFRYKRD